MASEAAATQSVLLALTLVAATTFLIFRFYTRRKKDGGEGGGDGRASGPWPFPLLKRHGLFEHTRAVNSALDEAKSDFCRIAWTMTDLLAATALAPLPEVWKYPGFGSKDAYKETAREMHGHLDRWLKEEMKAIDARPTAGLADRVVDLLSVTPAVNFAIEHKIPLQILQAKYMVVVSNKAQVRVLWFAFITNKVKAGLKSGPFVLKLLSSDLNVSPSNPTLIYTARRTTETQIGAITAKATNAIKTAIIKDEWEALEAF